MYHQYKNTKRYIIPQNENCGLPPEKKLKTVLIIIIIIVVLGKLVIFARYKSEHL